jgi:hypothetical protein
MMNNINDFVMSFMFLLVGVLLISVIADETTGATQAVSVNNETITLVNGTGVSLANNQLDSFTSLINATNAADALTVDVDFTVNLPSGEVTSITGNAGGFNATYVYREIGNATARSLVNMILVFFAIGIFMASVGFAVKGLREAGVF